MTDRQQAILSAIVELYARTAEPVGSGALVELFDMSSATIRNEMAALEGIGFIMQPHISAGRVPTDKGYRAYVNKREITPGIVPVSRTYEALRRRVEDIEVAEEAIKEATAKIAEITGNMGIATLPQQIYSYGLANLFKQPDFFSVAQAYELARLVDHLDDWITEAAPEGRVNVYIGRENPIGKDSGASLIISTFKSPFSDRSYIGVIGPTRQHYDQVIDLVEYTGKLLEESLGE